MAGRVALKICPTTHFIFSSKSTYHSLFAAIRSLTDTLRWHQKIISSSYHPDCHRYLWYLGSTLDFPCNAIEFSSRLNTIHSESSEYYLHDIHHLISLLSTSVNYPISHALPGEVGAVGAKQTGPVNHRFHCFAYFVIFAPHLILKWARPLVEVISLLCHASVQSTNCQ